jgi:uncharacterized protein YdeI (YjbR/CyaY-like superfamily)
MKMPKSLEEFWDVNEHHGSELQVLRKIILDCGLVETFKWAFPTYTLNKKNILSLGSFKEHYAIWFFQGVFLRDEAKVLSNAQEGKTKAMRHWKFISGDDLDVDLIKTYVLEAIDNQKKGLEVKVQRDTNYEMPPELKIKLDSDANLLEAFFQLTTGKQKEYANYIADAKQETTKLKRIDKITPMILEGKGLNDKYK